MFTFVLNFLRNFIAKWSPSAGPSAMTSDVVSDGRTPAHRALNPYKTNSANQNRIEPAGTIYVGMTTAQLIKALGPALTKQYDGNREIWTYLGLNGQGVRTHIAIQNGVVVNWQDVRASATQRFAGPAP